MMKKTSAFRIIKIVEAVLFFVVCLTAASSIDITNAPDEEMRYSLALFIYNNGVLPHGTEPVLIHPAWGFSYAFFPYLTSIISAGLMKAASLFSASEQILLIAARLTSVLSGTAAILLVFRIADELFEDERLSILAGTLVGFLPQFVFICSYQNNDSFAVFTAALTIYFWIRAEKRGWTPANIIGLGISCGLCALSYYNAYVYILVSIFFYFALSICRQKAEKERTGISGSNQSARILKGALAVFIIAAAVGGWFFIRNIIIHDGDMLGLRTMDALAELNAMDGFKPSQSPTPAHLGLSFADTFLRGNGFQETAWLPTVAGSFIGAFGNMTVKLPMLLYGVYFAGLAVGFIIFAADTVRKFIKREKIRMLLGTAFFIIIAGNLLLFMLYVYYSDYQAQGRYMMPSLIPIMLMVTGGYAALVRSAGRKKAAEISGTTAAAAAEKADGLKSDAYEMKAGGSVFICLIIVIYLALFFICYSGYMLPGCIPEYVPV